MATVLKKFFRFDKKKGSKISMYKNIGRKIKGFSIFFAWVIIAAACMFSFYRLFSNGKFDATDIIISVGIIIGGIFAGVVLSWFMYAFGVIAEKSENINDEIENLSLTVEDLANKMDKKPMPQRINQITRENANESENIPLESFKLPDTREELYASQLRKLKKDYEMSRITFDEYEDGKKRLEQKYR